MRMRVMTGKKYETRDGHAVRILCTDAKSSQRPVVGLITFPNGECIGFWTLEGTTNDPDMDLMPAPAKEEEK